VPRDAASLTPGAGPHQDLQAGRTVGAGHLEHSTIAGLLLAAGSGSRLGRPKALVELGGLTLAERGVALLRDGGTDPVVMVTGAAPVSLPGVIAAHNPDWRSGMGSSLREGLQILPQDREAVVIALVDQPLIGAAAVRRLIAAFRAGAQVAVACYQGRPRNPVLIARSYWADVAAAAQGDAGARTFLAAHPALVTRVECGDVGRPDDLDTPEDLTRLGAQLGSSPATTA
jgi:CTP:molybdopterin cytidylyltransferase MocA